MDAARGLRVLCLLLAASPCLGSGAGKVKMEVYYETLCPFCSRFISYHLNKLFDYGVISITDLKLIPYGNARVGPNSDITCQHGPDECMLNTVEACAIDARPDANEHFPFVHCIESLIVKGKVSEWQTCFEISRLDPEPVSNCYYGNHGKELNLRYAAETDSLQPPHRYVPWVLVDGQPLYENYMNFINYICNAYKGSTLPSACSKPMLSVNQVDREGIASPVCYVE